MQVGVNTCVTCRSALEQQVGFASLSSRSIAGRVARGERGGELEWTWGAPLDGVALAIDLHLLGLLLESLVLSAGQHHRASLLSCWGCGCLSLCQGAVLGLNLQPFPQKFEDKVQD